PPPPRCPGSGVPPPPGSGAAGSAPSEADLDLPLPRAGHQLAERQRGRDGGEGGVSGGGREGRGLDHRRSPRLREVSSLTILRTSCERALGITSTASPVRTTTRPSTPSTATVP